MPTTLHLRLHHRLHKRVHHRVLPATAQGLAMAGCLAGLALAAQPAGPVADPTRPPAAVQAALAASAAGLRVARADPAGGAPGLAAAAAASAPAAAPLPLLQGVHLPADGAPTAMLDGRLLKVGDSIGNRTVIGIDRQGVTLRGPAGTARVRLLGENAKQPPGSILIGMGARFQPAAAPLTASADRPGTDASPDVPQAASDPASAALAGRNRP